MKNPQSHVAMTSATHSPKPGTRRRPARAFAFLLWVLCFSAPGQYAIPWHTLDGGGGRSSSAGHRAAVGGLHFTPGSSTLRQTVSAAPGDADWPVSSDCKLKGRITPVHPAQVLNKRVQLPLPEWRYRGHLQRPIGAMAQDFHALLPLNESDTAITGGDLHGVALAAMQGLNRELNDRTQRAEDGIQKLEAGSAELERTLNEVKELMKPMNDKLNGGGQ